jgi:hypothetical protein
MGLQLSTIDAAQRLVQVDPPLVDEVHRDAEGGRGLRLPTRTCSNHRRPSSTVNSMSHMSRNRCSKVSA